MKHVLVFERAIRLGQYVTKCVGPFDSVEEAAEWYMEARKTFAMELPKVTLETLLDKDT